MVAFITGETLYLIGSFVSKPSSVNIINYALYILLQEVHTSYFVQFPYGYPNKNYLNLIATLGLQQFYLLLPTITTEQMRKGYKQL